LRPPRTSVHSGDRAAKLEHPHFVHVAEIGEDYGEVTERLQCLGPDRQRHGHGIHRHLSAQCHAGAIAAIPVGQVRAEQRGAGCGIPFRQIVAQDRIRDRLTVGRFDCDPLTRANRGKIAREHVEHHRRLRRVRDHVERSIEGHIAGVAVAFGDHAADCRIDRIDLQAFARFDTGQQLPLAHIVAHGLGHVDNSAGELTPDFRARRAGELDRAVKLPGFAYHCGTCGFDHHAVGLGGFGWDLRLSFRIGVFPLMALPVDNRHDLNVEAVRLDNSPLPVERFAIGLELEHVHLAVEAAQGDS